MKAYNVNAATIDRTTAPALIAAGLLLLAAIAHGQTSPTADDYPAPKPTAACTINVNTATPSELKMIYFVSLANKGPYFRCCRVNGAPKTWKTRPDVELPVKYGMYECARAVSRDGEMVLPNGGRLLVPIDVDGEEVRS